MLQWNEKKTAVVIVAICCLLLYPRRQFRKKSSHIPRFPGGKHRSERDFFSAVSFLFADNGVFPVLQVPHGLFLISAHFYKDVIVAGLCADFCRPDLIIIVKVVVVLKGRQHRNHLAHLPCGSVVRTSN